MRWNWQQPDWPNSTCALSTTCYYMATAMDKMEAKRRVLQPDASGDAHNVGAPVRTRDSARQLELELQMFLPDQETLEFWRATADYPQEVADRIAKFSRRMQQCASAFTIPY